MDKLIERFSSFLLFYFRLAKIWELDHAHGMKWSYIIDGW